MSAFVPPAFNAAAILEVLERHQVLYVIVGGFAANLYGAKRPTTDVDVVPAATLDNLNRLAAALEELDARIRTDAVPDGLPFRTSGEALRGLKLLNLTTPMEIWT